MSLYAFFGFEPRYFIYLQVQPDPWVSVECLDFFSGVGQEQLGAILTSSKPFWNAQNPEDNRPSSAH